MKETLKPSKTQCAVIRDDKNGITYLSITYDGDLWTSIPIKNVKMLESISIITGKEYWKNLSIHDSTV